MSLIDDKELLRGKIAELARALEEGTPYAMISASAILRFLLLDGGGFVTRFGKLKFEVVDGWRTPFVKLAMSFKPNFYAVIDALDPQLSLRPNSTVSELDLPQFLAYRVAYFNEQYFTVREFILAAANAGGGVHHGRASDPNAQTIVEADFLKISGAKFQLVQLRSIVSIVHRAIQGMR